MSLLIYIIVLEATKVVVLMLHLLVICINDAPALAKADIGMAISSGTDIAIESADIVLIGGRSNQTDLHGVVNALQISTATFNRIKINFLWAIIYNIFMLPFAMGCFYH